MEWKESSSGLQEDWGEIQGDVGRTRTVAENEDTWEGKVFHSQGEGR